MSGNILTTKQFIDTIGVGSHVSTGASGYGNIANVIADLKYLGVSNIRDGDNGSLNSLITLAQAGIKFDFLLAGGGAMATSAIQWEFGVINQVSKAVPGSVAAVEGANEINNFPITYNGVGGIQGAINMQQDIYRMAHADAALPGVAVYYFTGYNAGGVPVGPNPATTSGLADYDNQHPYPLNGNPPLQWVNRTQALGNETPATGPAVYTETGYSGTNGFGANIGPIGQAKYTLDLLMDDAQSGIARTYLYELLEEGDGLGMFDTAGNPKPVATAIHNLTSILADSGTVPATAAAANYSVSGLPSSGHSMAMLKSTGATDIVVWAEPQISTTTSGPAANVSVALGATYQTVKVFDPLQGTTPIQTLSNVSSVTLSVTDHPLIVETQSGSTPPSTPTSTNKLTLRVSEDAYQGDAQFVVRVDGKQVGGTMTASTLYATGDSDVFTLTGNWGQGTHNVQIQFLNDAWGGTAGTDRNLHVNSIAYDGTTYAGTTAALNTVSTRAFTVGGGTATAGAPADMLTVHLAEDAWNGNANFTVSIDGKPITTPQAVLAARASGAWEDHVFAGNLGAGSHTVAIAFTNDAWGGAAGTDRNLYVNGIDVNGKHYGTGATELYSTGNTASFVITTQA
jgi:hypothetical protein